MSNRLLIAALLLASPGCMGVPLRNNTVDEAQALGEVYERQVLNNLAMFASDPCSLPYFSYANAGTSTINEQGAVGVTTTWSRFVAATHIPFLFGSVNPGVSANRQSALGYTLTPVNDPRRLEYMRCAYQKSIAACVQRAPVATCPDCETRLKLFYTGNPDGNISASMKGAVTSDCLGRCCWLGIGCKNEIPSGCPDQLVAEYRGVYIWVLPGGQNELSKLTLAILDYAINSPPTEAQKTVYNFFDINGVPTTAANAVGVVTGTVGVTEQNQSLINVPRGNEAQLLDQLQKHLQDLDAQIAEAQRTNRTTTLQQLVPERQSIQGQIRFLTQQLSTGGLKQDYIGGPALGSGPAPPANGLFPVIQQLQQVPIH